jgi:autotransporter-associated beta strand protein
VTLCLEIAARFCCDRGMKRLLPIIYLFSLLIALHSFAGSATWKLDPVDGTWGNPANWEEGTFPNGPDDIATFNASNQTAVRLSIFGTEVSQLIFNPDASVFSITITEGATQGGDLTISGPGITNNSGSTQYFVVDDRLYLEKGATAGDMTFFTVNANSFIYLSEKASLSHGTFLIDNSEVKFGYGGTIAFFEQSTAADAIITLNGGDIPGGGSGQIDFFDSASAANGVFVLNGGTAVNAEGGDILFAAGLSSHSGTAGNATFIANSGTNGGFGGWVESRGPDQSTARIELFGNGTLDISYGLYERVLGSIEGDGVVWLGGASLVTGANNLSTTFSGIIKDGGLWGGSGGRFTKSGNATLTLTGANTYVGGTTIEGGKLVVKNITESATGTGPVQVNAGALAGRGIIAGAVVVGSGSGPGALLAPGQGKGRQNTLTIQSTLTFNSDGTYECGVNSKQGFADKVVANGVTIIGGRFLLQDPLDLALVPGTELTVIDNTSASPISGTFANLADDSTVTVGVNKLQVSYSGGDGNDLTLTVVE